MDDGAISAACGQPSPRALTTDRDLRLVAGDRGQTEDEEATHPWLAPCVERSAERAGNPPRYGKAEADPGVPITARLLSAEEWLEHPVKILRSKPAAVVFHAQDHRTTLAPRPNGDRSARRTVCARILDQVIDDLREQGRMCPHG